MPSLRDRGVYRLPDGKEYVAACSVSGVFFLFDCSMVAEPRPVFEVTEEGGVARRFGSGPEWRVEDLSDTGLTFDNSRELDC